MPNALIHGGTGQIGHALSARLVAAGWQVRVASRSGPVAGQVADHVRIDPRDPAAIRWLAAHVPTEGWEARIPVLAAYPRDHFDYAAEDRLLLGSGA